MTLFHLIEISENWGSKSQGQIFSCSAPDQRVYSWRPTWRYLSRPSSKQFRHRLRGACGASWPAAALPWRKLQRTAWNRRILGCNFWMVIIWSFDEPSLEPILKVPKFCKRSREAAPKRCWKYTPNIYSLVFFLLHSSKKNGKFVDFLTISSWLFF